MTSSTPDPEQTPVYASSDAGAVSSAARPETERASLSERVRSQRLIRTGGIGLLLIALLMLFAGVAARHWLQTAMRASLPQIDGTTSVSGLAADVSVLRDAHGVPTIRAASIDDVLFAQGFVTAQDRLWQMDAIRRHASGELAEILGPRLLPVDRAQRVLQIRAVADRAVAALPADQLHQLEMYARGVNASMETQRAHLPIEFRILQYQPRPWSPRDTLLIELTMFEDLTNSFPTKLNREAISSRLALDLPSERRAELLADLYPVGSWRDHPPSQPSIDLTAPTEEFEEVPLDPSQTGRSSVDHASPGDLLALAGMIVRRDCEACAAGSNNWVVSGQRTASGRPLLSNDMHLNHGVPGLWYETGLEAPGLHVAGVALPGAPFIIVGHNEHVAWGFTNLGADVQDLYVEHLRGSGSATEFEADDGYWRQLLHSTEVIHVHGQRDVPIEVLATQHGAASTPVITPLLPSERRTISLRWTIYDTGCLTSRFMGINSAVDSHGLVEAFRGFGGPAQNVVYADDAGHIGYHAAGRIPLRGNLISPSPLSPIPVDALDPRHAWNSYIPYEQLPQTIDPPGGIIATANARVTPDGYAFPITLNWADPYRNERIWKLLSNRTRLTASDMLQIQGDVYSEVDRAIAHRLAYAIDHSEAAGKQKRMRQAADLLRGWDGQVETDSAAATIVDAARASLWQMLLTPKLKRTSERGSENAWKLYTWGERTYAEEQIILHTPDRWLPPTFKSWDDLLAAAVEKGLLDGRAPGNLQHWRYGNEHPVEISHPVLSQSRIVEALLGVATGTGVQPQSGDGTTVKQVGRSFGPSERFTADLAEPDRSTLDIVMGQSGNPASPWFLDQFPAWYRLSTFAMPFSPAAVQSAAEHTLVLHAR